ncbi:MAG: RNA methyltransferase [Chitinophagales bacterium]|nr:RNA methyltransferase [Chitinophagales bacterium]
MRKLTNNELGRLTIEDFKHVEKTPLMLILENVRSAMNVGSVFRTADSFALARIILTGYTPTPPQREILKTALGATETVSWEHHDDILSVISTLKDEGVKVFAIEQAEAAIQLQHFKKTDGVMTAFILGNEVEGVSQATIDLCDGVIEIPQFGTKHSLNISVCAGIVAWQFLNE